MPAKATNLQSGGVTVAIVSDTHGYLDERIGRLVTDCDYAVHAGDIGDASVIDAMQPRKGIICVAGNNDLPERWDARQGTIVSNLPKLAELTLPGGLLVVEHGDRFEHRRCYHAALRNAHPRARAIVYGHTHLLACDTEEQPWVLNPGASGRVRTHGGASCLLLTAAESGWTVESRRFAR